MSQLLILRRLTVPAALLGTLLAAPAAAQTETLDEGTFRLLVGGRQIGTETFSIRRSGSGDGAKIISSGRVTLDRTGGAQQVTASLEVGAGLRPLAYQVIVEGPEPTRIAGRVAGGRFRAKILSPVGEQMREYLASDGAVLIDEGVAHHYYFLARRIDGDTPQIAIIVPRQNRQVVARVEAGDTERIEVAGGTVAARRLTVRPQGGEERRVWVDDQGRVLRLEIPARDYAAVRSSLP